MIQSAMAASDKATADGLAISARRRPPSPAEQARREAWGRDAGAKVAAAYKQLQSAA